MVIGLGVDVFEVSRMERALRKGDPDLPRDLFTFEEIAYCTRQNDPTPHFAERFALKEAVFKALSIDDNTPGCWRDVELIVSPGSAPRLVLHRRIDAVARERGVGRVLHSIVHAQGLTIARAILESEHD
jgi:holo-[acyl-carrier protein] synthase